MATTAQVWRRRLAPRGLQRMPGAEARELLEGDPWPLTQGTERNRTAQKAILPNPRNGADPRNRAGAGPRCLPLETRWEQPVQVQQTARQTSGNEGDHGKMPTRSKRKTPHQLSRSLQEKEP
ncbi:hypothetical protein IscW_ISCW013874 [Ixodes scapularis]|uniref:Uncharacterized protein n=1 Tax=Ixodes scapularis TaxID=6945 RepID=B7QM09_IXOSC|nr:hypothetical protein IscW_ISCW013874 [Ixodes scapularis]|eukprot:XP_002416214.1 hypothetical protein IscW_ISCW013874 [Ixodes scapularis]